jgi:hypothetical protein
MHGEGKRTTDHVVAAVLTAPTLRDAAAQLSVSERTLRRLLGRPAVVTAYRRARAAVVEHAITRLARAMDSGITTLEAHLGPGVPPAVRVRAALGIVTLALRCRDDDLVDRIEALEAQAEEAARAPAARYPSSPDSPRTPPFAA